MNILVLWQGAELSLRIVAVAFAGLLTSVIVLAEPENLATLEYKYLPEASGLTVSRIKDDRLWLINDSGNKPELIAFDYLEDRYQQVKVRKIKNRDWEDLAGFVHEGEPWLAIADVGDNRGKRKKVYVYLLPEPLGDESKVSVHTTLELRYPKGARDVESIAVDSQTRTLYLLSKREKSPRLYRVKLPELLEGARYEIEAERLGKVKSIPQPTKEDKQQYKYGENRARPTGMTLLHDGSAIAIMTYGGAYLAPLDSGRNWLDALNDNLCRLPTPELKQGETIGADARGRLYLTSEGKKAPLLRIDSAC